MTELKYDPYAIYDSARVRPTAGILNTTKVVGEATQATPTEDPSQEDTSDGDSVSPNPNDPNEQGTLEQRLAIEQKRRLDLQSFKDKQLNTKDQKIAELTTLNNQLKQEQSNKSVPPFPKTPEEMSQFKKEFPDVFNSMRTIAMEEMLKANTEMKELLQQNSQVADQIRKKDALAELLKLHPDALQLQTDQKFNDWLSTKSPEVRNIIENSINPLAVADQITLYKYETRTKTKTKTDSKDATRLVETNTSITPTGETKKIWKASEISPGKMRPHIYQKYEAEILEAMKEGRFIQDI